MDKARQSKGGTEWNGMGGWDVWILLKRKFLVICYVIVTWVVYCNCCGVG